jgi:hypothetical protein
MAEMVAPFGASMRDRSRDETYPLRYTASTAHAMVHCMPDAVIAQTTEARDLTKQASRLLLYSTKKGLSPGDTARCYDLVDRASIILDGLLLVLSMKDTGAQ